MSAEMEFKTFPSNGNPFSNPGLYYYGKLSGNQRSDVCSGAKEQGKT
jgi:hypothetical protein